jgi:hypothetical protein
VTDLIDCRHHGTIDYICCSILSSSLKIHRHVLGSVTPRCP